MKNIIKSGTFRTLMLLSALASSGLERHVDGKSCAGGVAGFASRARTGIERKLMGGHI